MGTVVRLDLKDWVSSREAAEMMGVRVQYIHRLQQLGSLTPTKIGYFNMFRRKDIERYVETHPWLGTRKASAS